MRDLSAKSIRKDCPHCRLGSFALEHPLYETKNFRIICDVHPLTEGHILIIPKLHLSCIGAFPKDLFKEFSKIYSDISNFLTNTYGNVSTFEHGIYGQTVYHSHIHLLQFNGKIEDIIPEGIQCVRPINDLTKLASVYKTHGGYLFFSLNGKNYLVDKNLAQTRFFRDRFAKVLGHPERGDWKKARNNEKLLDKMKVDILRLVKKWNSYQK